MAFRKIFTEEEVDSLKEDYGLTDHGLGVMVAVALGKGTPGSKTSNEKIQRTRSEAEVAHKVLCQPSLGVRALLRG